MTTEATGTASEYCPHCGEPIDDDEVACPGCGAGHVPTSRLHDLLETARSSTSYLWLLVGIIWYFHFRYKTKQAQKKILTYRNWFESAEDVHCRSCGERLPKQAEFCDHCGHENELAIIESIDFEVDEPKKVAPADFETSTSNIWWYGVLGGPILATIPLVISGIDPALADSIPVGAIFLVGGIVGIISILYDRKYVRANGPWHPIPWWATLQWLWGVSLVVAVVYMGKRVRTLGLDEHL